jgi:hypothetical protein
MRGSSVLYRVKGLTSSARRTFSSAAARKPVLVYQKAPQAAAAE